MRTIQRDIVGAVILSKDNKILLGMSNPKTSAVYEGSWIIPGGGVEPGESKLDALKHEILEETLIDISNYEIKLIDDTASGKSEKVLKQSGERVVVEMHFYDYEVRLTDKLSKDIHLQPPEELVQLKWIALADLPNYQVSPPSQKLFNKMGYLS